MEWNDYIWLSLRDLFVNQVIMGRTTVWIHHCAEESKRWENGTDDVHGTPRTKKKRAADDINWKRYFLIIRESMALIFIKWHYYEKPRDSTRSQKTNYR